MSEKTGSYRKEALEATLRKRKECSAKSLITVEKLIEKNVTQEILLQSVQFINQSSFQDVTDERSIMNMCGYPLCNNELRNIPKHQYRITRTNGTLLLYDTTERKKFCSNICYKASKYLKDQLPSCPLWLIQPKDTESVKLIPLDCKMSGGCGEQVNFGLKEVNESSQQLIVTDNIKATNNINNDNDIYLDADNDNKNIETDEYHDAVGSYTDTDSNLNTALDELANNITLSAAQHESCNSVDDKTILNITKSDLVVIEKKIVAEVADNSGCDNNNKVVSNSSLKDSVSEKFCDFNTSIRIEKNKCLVTKTSVDNEKTQVVHNVESTNDNKHVDNSSKISGKVKNSKHKKSKVTSDISPMLAAVLRTEQCIREWVSLDTLYFLLGEDKLRNLIEDTCGIDNFQGRTQKTMEDPLIYERYLAICKKLHLLELNESKFDQSVKNESNCNTVGPTQPLPDFERLKEEAKEMEIKVKAFYKGDKQVQFTVKDEKNDEEKRPISIPLVDQHAQRALRRRIVLDHLNRVLPDLLRTLGLSKYNSSNINTDVKTLVDTFTLSAHNITFRPAEWNFVAIVIIKLLSVRDEILNKTLVMERADKYLTLMLMSYEQDSGYLNRLLTWLLYEHTLFNF